MNIKHFLLIGAAMLAISSCSRMEDDIDSPVESSPVKMTFNVTADLMSQSRATSDADDPMPTRAFMYIRDNAATDPITRAQESRSIDGKFQFSLELDRSHTYTIAFWADCGGYDVDAAKGLEQISYSTTATAGSLIAYAKCETSFKPTESTYNIALQHAVAKLIIRETGTLNAGDVINVSFARNNYRYSAVSGSYTPASESTPMNLTHNVAAGKLTGDMLATYMLAPNEDHKANNDPAMMINSLTITYTPAGETKSHDQVINNVSFKANYRTVIAGNIMSLSKVTQSFSVSINNDWYDMSQSGGEDSPNTPDNPGDDNPTPGNVPVITMNTAGTLTNDMLLSAIGDGNSLKISGPINDADFSTLRAYLSLDGDGATKRLSLDLSDATFAAMPELAFCNYASLDKGYGSDNQNSVTGLGEIYLPEGLTAIPDGAFADCVNLKNVRIPSTVVSIAEMAFYRSGITSLNAPSVKSVDVHVCEECHSLATVVLGDLSEIYDYSFRYCENLTTFDITRCNSVPTAGQKIFGDGNKFKPENLTVYVSSQSIKDALSGDTMHWNSFSMNWVVGSPGD
ncbi:MAG: leucine-rich repeat domain-containing protein [Bacteroides sp.]|nr:leucine-rich repeat domain-containing protein [Bacteroides sp.]